MKLQHMLQLAHLKAAEWFMATPYKKWRRRDEPMHAVFHRFVKEVNALPRARVLEIGSRNVTGVVRRDNFSQHVDYVGFDCHRGENVNVVGDAHVLSEYFARASFDAIFAVSVFEHLAMPWKVVLELNRVLKSNGLLFLSTHPCWPAHELPWDFWRFQFESFKVLFNRRTGFQIRECVEGVPGKIIPLVNDQAVKDLSQCTVRLGVAVFVEKVGNVAEPFLWDYSPEEVLDTQYPHPQAR